MLATLAGLSKLPDDDQRLLYSDLVRSSLSAGLRKTLDMLPEGFKFLSPDFQRSYDKGKAEGEAKGKAEGEAKGKAEGEAKALLKILAKRGLALTARQRRKIRECTDMARLDRWLDRALSVASVEELFG